MSCTEDAGQDDLPDHSKLMCPSAGGSTGGCGQHHQQHLCPAWGCADQQPDAWSCCAQPAPGHGAAAEPRRLPPGHEVPRGLLACERSLSRVLAFGAAVVAPSLLCQCSSLLCDAVLTSIHHWLRAGMSCARRSLGGWPVGRLQQLRPEAPQWKLCDATRWGLHVSRHLAQPQLRCPEPGLVMEAIMDLYWPALCRAGTRHRMGFPASVLLRMP